MIKLFRNIRQNLLNEGKTTKYFKYAIGEIILVVIGILIALSINNWNENRKTAIIEKNILIEISNGLKKDLIDINHNVQGHLSGINSVKYWTKIINTENVNTDSVQIEYHRLLRTYASIQNTSSYESLKSRGLELVRNDSLRLKIISLYEEDYKIVSLSEADYYEYQFYENYFKDINTLVSPNFIFDSGGDIASIEQPLELNEKEKKQFLSYLMKIRTSRERTLLMYDALELKIKKLIHLIDSEIK